MGEIRRARVEHRDQKCIRIQPVSASQVTDELPKD